jgi:hypothetical protein
MINNVSDLKSQLNDNFSYGGTKVLKNAPLPQKRALQNGFASHRFRFTWFSRCEKKSQLKRRYNLYETPLQPQNAVTAAKHRYGREKSVTDKKTEQRKKNPIMSD